MIDGFSEETSPLSDYEKDTLLPLMIKGLSPRYGVENAITNSEMVAGLKKMECRSVTPARIRKLINHIRLNKLVTNLISSSKGYYRSFDYEEIKAYQTSLMQRASAITEVAKSFEV